MNKYIPIASLLACSALNISASEKPNIIFLLADDHRWDFFGFMGNKTIKTPNLDKLASDGVAFTEGYHASPICKPARASIMLSQYLNTHYCGFDKPSEFCITNKEFENSYPVLLRKGGYFTGFVGKFGFPVSEKKIINYHTKNGKRDPRRQLWKDDKYMPSSQFDLWYGFAGQGSYKTDTGIHGTELRGNQALEFITKANATKKPFCLSVSFKAPHTPYSPSKKWATYYSTVTIPSPDNLSQDSLPETVLKGYRGKKGYGKKFQSSMKKYYGLISGIDDQVSRIRQRLSELKIEKNTIIIYSSDNGYFCGSRGFSGKDLLYRESVRAPLIIFDPRLDQSQQNKKIDGLFSTIDFAPTMLSMANIPVPSSMQGKDLLPLLRQEVKQVNEAVFSENNFSSFRANKNSSVRSKAVQSEKFKYLRYHEADPVIEQLWDTSKDPMEENDLASNPEYAAVLQKMRQQCDEFVKETELARHSLEIEKTDK